MQKTKSINTQGPNTEVYSREKLQKSLEHALDKLSLKSCGAIYITQKDKSPIEAVLLNINEYKYLQQQLQTYNALLHDSTDKKLLLRLDILEQKLNAIQEGIDVIRYVK